MAKRILSAVILSLSFVGIFAQKKDSIKVKHLAPVTIKTYVFPQEKLEYLDDIHQVQVMAGKKTEVIQMSGLVANISEKTGRQIFAKIPGAFVYDMDGSGNQVNISTRGLDPHRSWEFNVRQNGVMTNSDMYGYPASHYSPPMEAIQRIELVRGTASLQYGAQFGGMINYVINQPDTSRKFNFENVSSAGSFGLLSSFNAIGGRVGKLTYYAYYQRRVSRGYRDNSRSDAQAQFASLKYGFSRNLSLTAELGRSEYLYQLPGPLNDSMFYANPRQSTRSRNYYSPDMYLPSLTFDWKLSPSTSLNLVTSAVIGTRSSVQFIGLADLPDTINATTQAYNPRQVDIDKFNSYTTELKFKQDYHLGKVKSTLVAGVRYIHNDLHRRQQGKGSTGSDFDLTIFQPTFGRDVHYRTQNGAFYLENLFRLTPSLSLSPGLRIENGVSKMRGIIAYLPNESVPDDILHHYVLPGVSAQYQVNGLNKVYGGWSQAYRPVIFADVIPATALDRTDPDLKDAFGHNLELGIKGNLFSRLSYDLNFFQVLYRNRIGTVVETDSLGQASFLKTNIGDSRTNGIELYADYRIVESNSYRISVFTSTSWMDGVYINGMVRNGNTNTDVTGNKLETVPQWISRNGLQLAYRQFVAVLQYSYVSKSWSNALNTEIPSSNGAVGLVPGYGLLDLNMSLRVSSGLVFKLSLNNITNKQYFTKRPTGYPGPGIWNSDGRGIVGSINFRI
ncbi:MAG: TonB-dependent receptor [Bacteroidia bacterium]|nr:TonB-dependent receptor [Bacteroidia bacterium]